MRQHQYDQRRSILIAFCTTSQGQQSPLCAALVGVDGDDPPTSVALVGNGPLSIQQREAINATERVVSFF